METDQMRITRRQLRRIIKEEKRRLLREQNEPTEERLQKLAFDIAALIDDEEEVQELRDQFAAELELKGIDLETHEIAQKVWEEAVEWSLE